MGYYSEVAITFTKEAHEKFTALLTAKILESKESYDGETPFDLLEMAEKRIYDSSIMYYWPAVKWYSDFPSIISITEALQNMDLQCFRFVRCGEEYDDIECFGDMPGPPYAYPQVTLYIDG